MRYVLLMNYREPADGAISEEAIAEAMEAFGAYGRALPGGGGAAVGAMCCSRSPRRPPSPAGMAACGSATGRFA